MRTRERDREKEGSSETGSKDCALTRVKTFRQGGSIDEVPAA